MVRKIALLLTILMIATGTGCNTEKTNTSVPRQGSEKTTGQNMGSMPQGERRPTEGDAFGASPQGGQLRSGEQMQPDNEAYQSENRVSGKVKSIVGNEVVLILSQPDKTVEKNKKDTELLNSESAPPEKPSESEDNEMANPEPKADNGAENESEQTATYLIPVGMPVGNKDFSAIKAGNTLTIYFGTHPEDGSEIITAVELRS